MDVTLGVTLALNEEGPKLQVPLICHLILRQVSAQALGRFITQPVTECVYYLALELSALCP
jgi:hypothetical protein